MDRDGTINEQMGYINHLSRFVLLPGTAEAVRLLNEHGYWSIVVSNQSGVARGYFPIELVHEVHAFMKRALEKEGAIIDGIFFCPHYQGGSIPDYSVDCDCRKPKTGLIDQACREFEIDLGRSYVIGDRYSDLELADRCGLMGILVQTGYGRGDMEYVLPGREIKPHHVAMDLLEAVQWILTWSNPNTY
jgi:D-glycero-D-manno-heptose 1,7-bisphosphate phosphatase